MKPIIGINVDIVSTEPDKVSIELKYVNSIVAAGGLPLLLTPVPVEDIPQVVAQLDGLMLIGGDDYDPSFYGHDVWPQTTVGVKLRQEFDLALAVYVLQSTELPLLGVCAGCQLINIALGGTLVQDIPTHAPESTIRHSHNNGSFEWHEVSLNPESQLMRIYNRQAMYVPTWHHQSVGQPGRGLNVTAHALDGIIEAVECPGDRFVLGVQWHPEQALADHLCLFQELVARATASTRCELPETVLT